MPLFFIALIVHDIHIAYLSLPAVLLYLMDKAFRCWQHYTNSTHVCVDDSSLVVQGSVLTLRTLWWDEVGLNECLKIGNVHTNTTHVCVDDSSLVVQGSVLTLCTLWWDEVC